MDAEYTHTLEVSHMSKKPPPLPPWWLHARLAPPETLLPQPTSVTALGGALWAFCEGRLGFIADCRLWIPDYKNSDILTELRCFMEILCPSILECRSLAVNIFHTFTYILYYVHLDSEIDVFKFSFLVQNTIATQIPTSGFLSSPPPAPKFGSILKFNKIILKIYPISSYRPVRILH